MRTILSLMTVLALIIPSSGCDDATSPEKDEDFILAVMVIDTGGQPMVGMSVARLNSLEGITPAISAPVPAVVADGLGISYPNPFFGATTIEYSIAETRALLLEVFDWRDMYLRTVLDGRQAAGFYSEQWDGMSSTGERMINGVYALRLTLTDTLDVPEYEFSDVIDCTVFDLRDPYRREMGLTDATGFFSIRDLDLFPSLQGHPPQNAYDEVKDYLGTFSFSDTVTIRVSTPPPSEGGYIYHMSRRVVLIDGPNYLEFHFVPDDSSAVR
jgi:hypothetical protein